MREPAEFDPAGNFPIRSATWVKGRHGWTIVAALIMAALLYFAFSQAPLAAIWATLRRLQIWQILTLLGIDAVIYLLVTARWWLIVHTQNELVPYFPLLAVRMAVFGVSYFTVGPQVGGEALQVLYLRRKHHSTYTRATASVVIDKLLELLANFLLLVFGLAAVLCVGILPRIASIAPFGFAFLAGLVAWPIIHVILLYRGHYPISALLYGLFRIRRNSKVVRFLRAAEHLASQFCQRHPSALLAGILVSLTATSGTLLEYSLILSFLRIGLPFWQTVSAWTVSWLSFLIPLPGGLGALEAGQVFTLGLFGISAASAIGVTFLMRGRDFLIGGLGILLAWNAARASNPKSPS